MAPKWNKEVERPCAKYILEPVEKNQSVVIKKVLTFSRRKIWLKKPETLKNTGLLNSDQILIAMREGQRQVVENLYDDFMEDFLSWAGRRFSGNQEDFEDAWQDAVIVFYENVKSGKLKALHCDVRTYLFAVGYKRLLKNNRKMKRIFWRDKIDDTLRNDLDYHVFEWDEPWAEERELLLSAMNQISPQCQILLASRYFDEKKLEEIQQEFHFNTPNSASASLSRCLNKLKDIIAGEKAKSGSETPH